MESRFEAYTASMENKLTSILKILAKEKHGTWEGDGSVDKTPLLPRPNMPPRNPWEEPTGNPFPEKFNQPYNAKFPRIKLSTFSGANPREWLRKCNNFFAIYQINEPWRMEVIELYLEDKAEIWYQSLKMVKGNFLGVIFRTSKDLQKKEAWIN